jgi:hypothetical protein
MNHPFSDDALSLRVDVSQAEGVRNFQVSAPVYQLMQDTA